MATLRALAHRAAAIVPVVAVIVHYRKLTGRQDHTTARALSPSIYFSCHFAYSLQNILCQLFANILYKMGGEVDSANSFLAMGRDELAPSHPPKVCPDDHLHGLQGHYRQKNPCPGEGCQHQNVIPYWDAPTRGEMEKIGHNISCIWVESQPYTSRQDQQPPAPGKKPVQSGGKHTENVGNPGERQVPVQVCINPPRTAEEHSPQINCKRQHA